MRRSLAIAWCRFSGAVSRALGIRPLGLGIALRAIGRDFAFTALSRRYWFDHRVAPAYALLPTGVSNEPETAAFLTRIAEAAASPCEFIEVGASIGEFAILAAGLPGITRVVAFEPQQACCEAIRRSAELNGFAHVEAHQAAVSERPGRAAFAAPAHAPTTGRLAAAGEPGAIAVETVTLDGVFAESGGPAILLIDVEGAELSVVRGGREWIRRARPLIVFEYNEVTARYFALPEMAGELGSGYTLWRLRPDGGGRLDASFENTWNIVAAPSGSPFSEPCRALACYPPA